VTEGTDDGVERARARLREQLAVSPKEISRPVVPVSDAVRAHATRTILAVYVVSIAFIAVLIFLQGHRSGDFDKAIANFSEVMKIAVLPVVTFVLGRYFGNSER
jgi:hypothetical protein